MKKTIEEWMALDYLYDCRDKLRAYVELSDKRDMIKASLLPRAIRYTQDKIQTTPEDYFTKTMAKVADMDTHIDEQRAEVRRARMVAEDIIDGVRGAKCRLILFEYFTETSLNKNGRASLNSWESIAARHGWSVASVSRNFYRAIDRLTNVTKK